jgi:hypothetical protein
LADRLFTVAAEAWHRVSRQLDYANDFGTGVDVRVFVTDERYDRIRAARARVALSGRRFNGSHRDTDFYVGPTRQGVLLQPGAAAVLADLLARAFVEAEADPTD